MRFAAAFPAKRVIWRTEHLRDAGFSSRSLDRLIRDGVILRMRRGCYARASWWQKLSANGRLRQRIRIHQYCTLATSPQGFVYSHISAAAIHGLHVWNVPERIHVTQASRPSGLGQAADVQSHSRPLGSQDVVEVDDFMTTTLERTVIDCALSLPYRQALVIADQALRAGASRALLQNMASMLTATSGVRNLRRVLQHANALSESVGETLCRDLMRELRLPAPVCQLWIRTRLGSFRADFAWEEEKVVLEFDGKGKYFDYRPTDEAVYLERKRESALIEAGWTVIRVQWADLFRSIEFKLRMVKALGLSAAG